MILKKVKMTLEEYEEYTKAYRDSCKGCVIQDSLWCYLKVVEKEQCPCQNCLVKIKCSTACDLLKACMR